MKPLFKPAHAESWAEFLELTGDWKLTFSYVHEGPFFEDAVLGLPDAEPYEQYLAFDMAEHGPGGHTLFLETDAVDRRAGAPLIRPVPYWDSFVRGMGPYSTVYSLEDARAMVLKARAEMRTLWRAFELK
jgi:hypothetical protein